MNTAINLSEPWYLTENDLSQQLKYEINDKHILFGKEVKTIAQRQDRDDVLFEIMNGEFKYAIVHLTFMKDKQHDEKFPLTTTYKDWEEVYNRIKIDEIEFVG